MRIFYFLVVIWIICLGGCGKESASGVPNAAPGSGKAGSLARFSIVGNYLYALDGSDIVVYNIAVGNTPVYKNRVRVGFDIETMYPYEGKLFIGSQTGMYAFSLDNPELPKQLSVVTHVRSCDPVVVQGNFAYVTLRSGTVCGGGNVLNVYNVSNLFSPVLVKTIPVNAPYGLGVESNALYVTHPDGITLYNISQPQDPVLHKNITEPTASDVIPYNNTLIVQLTRGASFYDISNPLNPLYLSRIIQ